MCLTEDTIIHVETTNWYEKQLRNIKTAKNMYINLEKDTDVVQVKRFFGPQKREMAQMKCCFKFPYAGKQLSVGKSLVLFKC